MKISVCMAVVCLFFFSFFALAQTDSTGKAAAKPAPKPAAAAATPAPAVAKPAPAAVKPAAAKPAPVDAKPVPSDISDNSCTLDSILFATGIDKRVPVGVNKDFDASTKKVFCWTKLSIQNAPTTVNHVWYNYEEKVAEIPLTLNFASGRLWSYKTVSPGQWKVEVVTAAGTVLGSATFTVK
jgi:hypothetical protein